MPAPKIIPPTPVEQTAIDTANVANQVAATNADAMILNLWGYQLNLMTVLILGLIVTLFYMFYTIQKSERLDFADMFTKDGRKVSATKVMQFIAGIATTWFIIKTGLQGTLSVEMLAVYLAFMASVEGFSKFVSAKYNYKETSVAEANEQVEDKKDIKKMKMMAVNPMAGPIDAPLDVSGDGPVEATVTQTTTPGGQTIVQKKIKKG